MAINEKLTARIREIIAEKENDVEEKKMFGGICFMVNDKMTVCAANDRMLVRLDPQVYEAALEKPGCRPMEMKGKPMNGYVYVDELELNTAKKLGYWISLALGYNKVAQASKKKKKPPSCLTAPV
jgi:TfoX/Sxy family transcriptional regulator of competence genes